MAKINNSKINAIGQEAFARLLSTEGINVRHDPEAKTAAFDLKNRNIILPVYKNITENVYYLFVGHEVSHALFTPAEDYLKAVEERKKEYPFFDSVLNIVEDARAERMIKKKYPGLPRFFSAGYRDLNEDDFFKIKEKKLDLNKLNLADTINLYYKLGLSGAVQLPISDVAKPFIDRINKVEKFEEVIQIAVEISEKIEEDAATSYSKMQYQLSDGSGLTDEEKANAKTIDELDISEEEKQKLREQLKELVGQTDTMSDGMKNFINGNEGADDQDEERAKNFVYANFPNDTTLFELNKSVVIDFKTVHKDIEDHYSKHGKKSYDEAEKAFHSFEKENLSLVMYLIKQFEMKKSCEEFKKTHISITGNINTSKLYSYKFDENIFKNREIVPTGKNHGLVMFLDCSGSMSHYNVYASALKQIVVLVLFCRKLNIPFEVYGFSDADYYSNNFTQQRKKYTSSTDRNTVNLTNCVLKNYVSSRMNFVQFNLAMKNIFAIIGYYSNRTGTLPNCESLGATPLNSAMLYSIPIINKFKGCYKLEKVNTIILSDGFDESTCNAYGTCDTVISSRDYSVTRVLSNPISRKQYKEGVDITAKIFEFVRDQTGNDIIWFYLIDKSYASSFKDLLNGRLLVDSDIDNKAGVVNSMYNTLKKNNSVVGKNIFGCNDIYFIDTNTLNVVNDNMSVEDLKNAKDMKGERLAASIKRAISNKIILDKFIEKIA